MNFSKHIANLLYNYECVVIPGLGGLITNDKTSQVNRVSHNFNPPYRKIFFNKHLTADDGLLTNHVALNEGISFNNARTQIKDFVADSLAGLDRDEVVELTEIGTLKYDANKNIVFEQDITVNYNPHSFGLGGFVSPPVKRQTDQEVLRGIIAGKTSKPKPVDRKAEVSKERKKGAFRPVVSVITLILLVISLSWAFLNIDSVEDYLGEQASIFPFSKSKPLYIPRATVAQETDKSSDMIPKEHVSADKMATEETDLIEKSKEVENNNAADVAETDIAGQPNLTPEAKNPELTAEMVPEPVPVVRSGSKSYYIVAGSFSIEANANKLVGLLKEKGFEASIADTNKNGMFRVAYFGIESLAIAKEKLIAIRQEDNADAWILRK